MEPEESFVAVGDIHGRFDLLQKILPAIQKSECSRLVFLGDYVDRGENSAQVLRALCNLDADSDDVVCLRGNHEDMLLSFIEDPVRYGPEWLQFGGRQTLVSFEITSVFPGASDLDWVSTRDWLREAMGSQLISWLRGLPVMWKTGNIAMVHAGADPACAMTDQNEEDLVWGHEDFFRSPRHDGIWVVHGHTVVENVCANQGRIGVDTGAYATGRLSAVFVRRGSFEIFST